MRQYKRIVEQQEREKAKEQQKEDEQDEPYQVKRQNVFDLLSHEDGNDASENVQEEEEIIQTQKPKKKKKKKKANGETKDSKKIITDDEFLEQELKRVQELKLQSGDNCAEDLYNDQVIDFTNLNPENEFMKLFGKKAISRTNQAPSDNLQQLPKNIRNNRHHKLNRLAAGSSNSYSSSQLFVKPKSHWPPFVSLGLAITLLSTKGNVDIYTITQGDLYRNLQKRYQLALQSHDPNNFVHLLQRDHPYHLHTLLQLSEFYRTIQREADQAQDMLERILFALQTLIQSNSQFLRGMRAGIVKLLPYSSNELNQLFYHALLARTHAMSRSGAHRTAFELAKLIYTLSVDDHGDDIEDPVHVLLFIDFYAVTAAEYDWFLSTLLPQLESNENLRLFVQLPNMMYSKAMALFYSDRIDEATEAMKEAMLMWPMILGPLLEECKLASNKLSEWEQLMRNTTFTNTICTSQLFTQLLSANVKRMETMYKNIFDTYHNEHIVQWLKKCATEVTKVNNKELEQYNLKRQALYDNPLFKNNYPQVYAEEVVGNMLPIISTNTRGANANIGTTNPVLLFFQTLLPWNNLPEDHIEEYEVDENDQVRRIN
jgi:hypothetical protein